MSPQLFQHHQQLEKLEEVGESELKLAKPEIHAATRWENIVLEVFMVFTQKWWSGAHIAQTCDCAQNFYLCAL